MADPSNWGGVDENDPKSVSRFMKRMNGEMGDEFRQELGGDFEEMAEREMSGAGPDGSGPDGPDPYGSGGADDGTDSGTGDV